MADFRRSTGQMPYQYRDEGIAGMSALDRREEAVASARIKAKSKE